MNTQQKPQKITLEEIALRKEAVRKKLNIQKDVMEEIARSIFAPLVPAASAANKLQRAFSTGMALFNGVMLGVKVIRSFRSFFR